ncbi:elongation factor P hydroxylase [Agarilytica rhodophyticola]|uniref:elongation factor P hydroxylase n=1 Tax=Agarilytica rhodophyticola TaxID=1737490 RepID=UPI000B342BC5|nr:elongation factor P hydroxylase [Agarilytica rhodophyticola]
MSKEFIFSSSVRLKILIDVFNTQFFESHHTLLMAGGEEPLYEPASGDLPSRITFTRDYFSSALHEISHWCIAGAKRRLQLDYGYWYAPDGRSYEQQALFERVEVKPQALERIFACASRQKFVVSADNLGADLSASKSFSLAIHEQTLKYCQMGLPERAHNFVRALAKAFQVNDPLSKQHYLLQDLI